MFAVSAAPVRSLSTQLHPKRCAPVRAYWARPLQVPCMVRIEVEKTQRLQFQVRWHACYAGMAGLLCRSSPYSPNVQSLSPRKCGLQVTVATPDSTVTAALKDLICQTLSSM